MLTFIGLGSAVSSKDWSKAQVAQWLIQQRVFEAGEEHEAAAFVDAHGINGMALLELTEEDIVNELGMKLGPRKVLLKALRGIEESAVSQSKSKSNVSRQAFFPLILAVFV